GFNMFSRVYPEKFGIRFPFEMEPFSRWALRALDEGRLAVTRPLEETVVLHDSCHARILGDGFMEEQRQLLRRLSVEVLETRHNKADGLCCGMAAGANTQSGPWMISATLRRLDELNGAGAPAIAAYCAGCFHTFLTVRPLRPGSKPVVHTLELLRRALGEDVDAGAGRRARQIVLGVAARSVPRYLDPRRFLLGSPPAVR
ncbi:MAG: (Fe-S)-binding protein, partial [Pseudomonadota bacterium]